MANCLSSCFCQGDPARHFQGMKVLSPGWDWAGGRSSASPPCQGALSLGKLRQIWPLTPGAMWRRPHADRLLLKGCLGHVWCSNSSIAHATLHPTPPPPPKRLMEKEINQEKAEIMHLHCLSKAKRPYRTSPRYALTEPQRNKKEKLSEFKYLQPGS